MTLQPHPASVPQHSISAFVLENPAEKRALSAGSTLFSAIGSVHGSQAGSELPTSSKEAWGLHLPPIPMTEWQLIAGELPRVSDSDGGAATTMTSTSR